MTSPESLAPAQVEPKEITVASASAQFTTRVEKQFAAELGMPLEFSPLQKRLAQHIFLKVHADLKALETKRAGDARKEHQPEISWANVNMHKLGMDAVHLVSLELDALIKNHIHVVPYLNSRTQK